MVYVFLADGFEELEAMAPIDILRRAKQKVITVGVSGKKITSSHKVTFVCDKTIKSVKPTEKIDAIILPGGMPGTVNLEKNAKVSQFIDFANEKGKIIGAICAAPSILGHKGILKGKKATCFSSFDKDLIGAEVTQEPVEKDGNIITAFGAGAAFQFGFELLSALTDKETAENIRKAMRFGE
ncbi:MAG: DJ-1/PfpI family protein [Clostridia bacterium]|nr:DJ-1/PfpI family protein [Clostridia bacterium]